VIDGDKVGTAGQVAGRGTGVEVWGSSETAGGVNMGKRRRKTERGGEQRENPFWEGPGRV